MGTADADRGWRCTKSTGNHGPAAAYLVCIPQLPPEALASSMRPSIDSALIGTWKRAWYPGQLEQNGPGHGGVCNLLAPGVTTEELLEIIALARLQMGPLSCR